MILKGRKRRQTQLSNSENCKCIFIILKGFFFLEGGGLDPPFDFLEGFTVYVHNDFYGKHKKRRMFLLRL